MFAKLLPLYCYVLLGKYFYPLVVAYSGDFDLIALLKLEAQLNLCLCMCFNTKIVLLLKVTSNEFSSGLNLVVLLNGCLLFSFNVLT